MTDLRAMQYGATRGYENLHHDALVAHAYQEAMRKEFTVSGKRCAKRINDCAIEMLKSWGVENG